MNVRSAAALLSLLLCASPLGAQGVTTSAIAGRVVAADGSSADAQVQVVHEATGYSLMVRAVRGHFLVQGLEPGGPYTLTVRALGYAPERVRALRLTLGELRELSVVLQPVARRLDTVAVAARGGGGVHDDGGTGTTIADSLIERLPSLDRDLYDFVRLVPQISTQIGIAGSGMSAAGQGFRLNDYLINGVSERTTSGGVSNAFSGLRSLPLDAVREYQVLLSPYDVRYGDFAGALVNTVTKSGTNELRGSAFAFGRTDRLGRGGALAPPAPYERAQVGLSVGGPIVRDRLHFFVATELQHLTSPVEGPYAGQPASARPAMRVSDADLARFDGIMRDYGLTAGSPGAIEIASPARNVFARLDLALPRWRSRLIAWDNWASGGPDQLSRAKLDTFSFSSYATQRDARNHTTVLHLHSSIPRAGGGSNELLVARRRDALDALGEVDQPIVRVSVPSTSGGSVTLNSGTNEIAQRSPFRAGTVSIRDDVTLPFGASHVATFGAEAERFGIDRGTGVGSYGTWSFANLDAFALGIADRYVVRVGWERTEAPLRGEQYAAFAGDRWRVNDRLSLTGGVRGDLLVIRRGAPYEPAVDSIFGRRTDAMPRRRVELSPRIGFVWDVAGTGAERVRGGVGIFTARYPLAWAQAALSAYGAATGTLSCSGALRPPPAFEPDYRSAPTACRSGAGLASFRGDVDLLDRELRLARVARASLAYERRLPASLLLTGEALITRALSDFAFVNLNLRDPVGTDANGRTMYGTIAASGAAVVPTRSDFAEVIALRSVSRGGSSVLSARLETTRLAGVGGLASYTYSRARDVQTPTRVNVRGLVAWASARPVSGRHDDLAATRSGNDVPHRVVLAGTYRAPWRRASTALAFYWVGESGRPFTYVAGGALGLGDLNADGSNADDPIYVPRDAMDSTEILFSGVSTVAGADTSSAARASRVLAQREAFGALMDRTACLRRQRGRILERNSCREPWTNTTIASLRQAIPVGARTLEAQVDLFNVLNLLNARWGLRREASAPLLEHVGQSVDPVLGARPVFRYDATAPDWITVQEESAFQLQVALRYRF